MSSRFPMGVETMYRMPEVFSRDFNCPLRQVFEPSK